MNNTETIIGPGRFDVVKNARARLGYPGMTVTLVHRHDTQKGISQVWRRR